jgi:hypothetical protein
MEKISTENLCLYRRQDQKEIKISAESNSKIKSPMDVSTADNLDILQGNVQNVFNKLM